MHFALLLAFMIGPAPAAERVRLADLAAEALRANPAILAAQKKYEAARQRPSQAASLPDPMLSAGYASAGSPRPFAGIGREPTANAGVMVTQEFPFPGKRKLRGEIAQAEAGAEFEQYKETQLGVLSRLKQAYYRLDTSYAETEVLAGIRELSRQFLRVTEARYAAGKSAQQDVFKAQLQLSILETRLERLEQEKRSRQGEINTLLGRPVESPLPRPEEPADVELRATLEELLGQAMDRAPALRREEKMVQRSELAVNLARKDYYPDYALSAGYFNMGGMPDMYQFRVDFRLPAWFWRKQRPGVAEQASALAGAQRSYENTSRDIAFRIKEDYLAAETSARLAKMYSGTVIPQATLALESSLFSYETGAVDALTVFGNLSTVLDYRMNYLEEKLSLRLALVRLEEMTGSRLAD